MVPFRVRIRYPLRSLTLPDQSTRLRARPVRAIEPRQNAKGEVFGLNYHPEAYWSGVATEIRKRGPQNRVAGDDNPFFRYKRQKFLRRFLASLDFRGKVVLEVGCGPGGNLLEVVRSGAPHVIGIDISSEMLALVAETLHRHLGLVELRKTDGERLPLADRSVDLAFTVTVLQHNTDPAMFQPLVAELCRVTRQTLVLIEDTRSYATGPNDENSWIARPVETYAAECRKHGFRLTEHEFLGIKASRMAHNLIRRLLVPPNHREGNPFASLPLIFLNVSLIFTRPLDKILPDRCDLTKMVFVRS